MQRVLGLDLGTNSIGWAVIDVPDGDEDLGQVVAMGSRIFAEGAEAAGAALVTPAKDRRQKRSMRRQVQRRAKRRRRIRTELSALGLLPVDDREFESLMASDPAVLIDRSDRGEELTLREIGRVVYWFSSRRGFLSLRKGGGDFTDDDDDRSERPRYRRNQIHGETGEIVQRGQEDKLLGFLAEQAVHHPDLLTDQVIYGARGRLTYPVRPIRQGDFLSSGSTVDEFGIHGLVFFQRSVYWDESTIGRCSIDPRSGGPRALRADRLAQKYRVWKTVVDLRVGPGEGTPLTSEEREKVVGLLSNQKTASFGGLRRTLGLEPDEVINLERSGRDGLVGNETDAALRSALKTTWDALEENQRDRVASILLGNAPEDQVRRALASEFGLPPGEIDAAVDARFPSGRAAFGRRTLRRLLVEIPTCDDERDAIDNAGLETPEKVRSEREVVVSEITNPLVRKTLNELRKVLPAVAASHGREGSEPFDVVRIELTRDVRANYRSRQETNRRQRELEKANDAARTAIDEFGSGLKVSRDGLRRHRLWVEQGECCLYCGQPISAVALFGNQYELDHIIPRARTLDDSMANMALVHASENSDKGDRTPVEWRGIDGAQRIADRAKGDHPWRLIRGKVDRILREEVDEEIAPAALVVITGYINSLARDLVQQEVGIKPEVSSGRLTAALRYRMGLNKASNDHRRHAMDAAMVALTDLRTARSLADRYRRERDHGRRRDDQWGSYEPWPGLRDDIDAHYDTINVSHAAKGRIRGQLHNETNYGRVNSPYLELEDGYAFRRPVTAIDKPARLTEVADPAVKAALIDNLQRRGISPDATSFKFDVNDPPRMPDGTAKDGSRVPGTPILKVRCHKNYPGNRIIRPESQPKTGVAMDSNHTAYVYENSSTGRWRVHVVQRFDAFTRRNRSLSELRTMYALDDESFLFSVTVGSTLQLATEDGSRLFYVKSLNTANRRMDLRPVADTYGGKKVNYSAKKLRDAKASKVVVLPSGEVRTARD